MLGQSNARVESLGTLQQRAATYQSLQTQAQQLRQLLAIRVAEDPSLNTYLGGTAQGILGGRNWILVDKGILAMLSQLGPATNATRFGFVPPPPEDEVLLRRIRLGLPALPASAPADHRPRRGGNLDQQEQAAPGGCNQDRQRPRRADRPARDHDARADERSDRPEPKRSYAASRNLFIGVGAGSILLALLLGFVLSWSLVGPIQRTEARLAEIAAGDFSRHVEVPNRDELGALAVNLNRMNDELRRLYEELETVSRHKSEFLANMSHELRTPLNAIIGFSELLQQQLVGELNEQQLGYVEDVLDAGRHLLALINDILDLSKVEAGKMELELADVSLRPTLESGLTMNARAREPGGVALG